MQRITGIRKIDIRKKRFHRSHRDTPCMIAKSQIRLLGLQQIRNNDLIIDFLYRGTRYLQLSQLRLYGRNLRDITKDTYQIEIIQSPHKLHLGHVAINQGSIQILELPEFLKREVTVRDTGITILPPVLDI